jgi:glucose-6-phosphate 1-dehydrogenase
MGTFDSADLLLGAQGRPAPPCVMVIFGAAGDLTKRKLIPALYNLARSRLLPDQFAIVGVSREEYSIDEFRTRMAPEAGEYTISELDRETWDWFAKRLYYMSGDFQDPKLFQKLEALLAEVEKEQDTQGNCIFYLATSPTFFPSS